jgi:hypothetical protein
MMWQILIAVLLVWFAVSVAAAVLVGRVLRGSSAALNVYAPRLQAEGPSSPDMVQVG